MLVFVSWNLERVLAKIVAVFNKSYLIFKPLTLTSAFQIRTCLASCCRSSGWRIQTPPRSWQKPSIWSVRLRLSPLLKTEQKRIQKIGLFLSQFKALFIYDPPTSWIHFAEPIFNEKLKGPYLSNCQHRCFIFGKLIFNERLKLGRSHCNLEVQINRALL